MNVRTIGGLGVLHQWRRLQCHRNKQGCDRAGGHGSSNSPNSARKPSPDGISLQGSRINRQGRSSEDLVLSSAQSVRSSPNSVFVSLIGAWLIARFLRHSRRDYNDVATLCIAAPARFFNIGSGTGSNPFRAVDQMVI
jgi:hypothetical protein